jgi:hypothetical protein
VRKRGEGRRTHGYARPDEKEDPPWLDRAGRVEDALEKERQGRREQGVSSQAMRGPAVFDARRLRVLK